MVIGENRAKDLFLDALELSSSDERRALLDERCTGNESLRRGVEELLVLCQSITVG
jgi:hypothetical protein